MTSPCNEFNAERDFTLERDLNDLTDAVREAIERSQRVRAILARLKAKGVDVSASFVSLTPEGLVEISPDIDSERFTRECKFSREEGEAAAVEIVHDDREFLDSIGITW